MPARSTQGKKKSSKKKAPAKKGAAKKRSLAKVAKATKPAAKKKAAKKASKKKAAKKKAASSSTKPIGSGRSRRRIKEMTKRVLAHCADQTPTQAAPVLGVSVDDVRNMRQGNNISVPILLKMVRVGHFDPLSIIDGPALKKLPKSRSTRGAQQRLLDARIRKLAWTRPGKEWAKLTGLSVTGAYGLRYASGAHVTLYTVLGFMDAGHTIDELLFGGKG